MTTQYFIPPSSLASTLKLLQYLRALQVAEPIRNLRDVVAASLEHLLAPATASLAAFDAWTLKQKYHIKRIQEVILVLPPDTFKQHVVPLFPGLAQQLATLNLESVTRELYQRAATHLLEQATAKAANLASRTYGTETLGLLRALASGVDKRRRAEVANLFTEAHRALRNLTLYDANQEALADDTGDNALLTLTNAVHLLGTLYESRGKIVLDLLWGLAHLNGWRNGKRPNDGHKDLAENVLPKFLPAHNLGEFNPDWRHWRNAKSHNLVTGEFDGVELHIRITDKDANGKITYNKVFSGVEILITVGKAWELLQSDGAYPTAIELLQTEYAFDALSEDFLATALGKLLARVT